MRFITILLAALMLSAYSASPALSASSPATKPSSKPAEAKTIKKGMTLTAAEKIAGFAAKLIREDDDGFEYYQLNVWDESQDDEEIQRKYTLKVADKKIVSYDVEVSHHPRPVPAGKKRKV
jgi:hypothetical protein